jgi:hypothetical protein
VGRPSFNEAHEQHGSAPLLIGRRSARAIAMVAGLLADLHMTGTDNSYPSPTIAFDDQTRAASVVETPAARLKVVKSSNRRRVSTGTATSEISSWVGSVLQARTGPGVSRIE